MNTNIQLSIIPIGEKRLYSLRAFHCQWNEWNIYSGFFKGSLATTRWFSSSLPLKRFHLQCGSFQGKERIFLRVAVALTRKSKSVGNFRVELFISLSTKQWISFWRFPRYCNYSHFLAIYSLTHEQWTRFGEKSTKNSRHKIEFIRVSINLLGHFSKII